MAALPAHDNPQTESLGGYDEAAPRERRARRVAARQGFSLDKTRLRCGGAQACRYDLVDARYGQASACQLELTAVEVWLGIRPTTRH